MRSLILERKPCECEVAWTTHEYCISPTKHFNCYQPFHSKNIQWQCFTWVSFVVSVESTCWQAVVRCNSYTLHDIFLAHPTRSLHIIMLCILYGDENPMLGLSSRAYGNEVIINHLCSNERGEMTTTYKWTNWIWEIIDWISRLQENYWSFMRNLWRIFWINTEVVSWINLLLHKQQQVGLEFWPIIPKTLHGHCLVAKNDNFAMTSIK